MKKLYVILFAMLCLQANAQWKYANYPHGGDVQAMATLQNKVFAVFAGTLYSTTDKGDHWINTMNGLPNVETLIVSGTRILASTEKGVYASNDSGNSWQPSGTGIPDSIFIAAFASDGNILLAEGMEDAVFKSEDNGLTWHNVYAGDPTMYVWHGQHLSIHGKLGAVSTKTGVLTSINGGENWIETSSPEIPPYNATCLLVNKTKIYAGFWNVLMVSADSGKTWNELNTDLPGSITSKVLVLNKNVMYLGTDKGIFFSDDEGLHWGEMYEGLPVDSDINAIVFNSDGFYTGTSKNVFLSTNLGKNWVAKNNDVNKISVKAIEHIGERLITSSSSGVIVTDDNTATWSWKDDGLPVRSPGTSMTTVDSLLVLGGTAGIYISTDKADNWQKKSDGLPAFEYVSELKSRNGTIYASMYTSLYASSDRGETWIDKGPSMPNSAPVYHVGFHGSSIFVVSYLDGVHKSTDDGATWTDVSNGLPASMLLDDLVTVGDALFIATGSGLYKTVDDGANWTVVSAVPQEHIWYLALAGNALVVSMESGLLLSTDQGATWRSIKDGLPSPIINYLHVKDNTVYAGTNSGLWYRSLSELTGVEEQDETVSLQIYPNPSTGVFTLSSSRNMVQLDVYNLLGECVYSARPNTAGTQLNLQHLAKGIYNVNIRTENKLLINKKIVIQ